MNNNDDTYKFRTEYWTDADAKFWSNVVANVTNEKMIDLIKLMYPNFTDMKFYDDCGELGMYSFMDGTYCCSISMDDPPFWLVIKLIRHYNSQ